MPHLHANCDRRDILSLSLNSDFVTGNLHFANVRVEDGLSDRHTNYVCASFNEVLRSLTQGEDQRIIPIQRRGRPFCHRLLMLCGCKGCDLIDQSMPVQINACWIRSCHVAHFVLLAGRLNNELP